MPVVITIPRDFKGNTLSKLVANVAVSSEKSLPPEIVFDFSQLNFIRPAGVVFLNNLINWLREHKVKVDFSNWEQQRPALRFLDDSLFFEKQLGRKIRNDAAPRATTRPLTDIAHERSHEWLETNFVPWLARRLGTTEASLYEIRGVISELFNNIQDHTRYDIGSIFVQHFPAEDQINISVSDWGVGIPAKVREKMPQLSDPEAIIQATEEGFTTGSTQANFGLGLDTLLQTVVSKNGGRVTVYSGRGIVRFRKQGSIVKSEIAPDVGFCPGTTIDINIRTDTLEHVPDEREDLQW
jgi:anti-sigma regulatory factor (Ser/Thr protein kinase)